MKNDSKFLFGMLPVAIAVMAVLFYSGHQTYTLGTGIAYFLFAGFIGYKKYMNWKPSKGFLQAVVYVSFVLLVLTLVLTVGAMVATMLDLGDYRSTIICGAGGIIFSAGLFFGVSEMLQDLYPPDTNTTLEVTPSITTATTTNRLDNWDDDGDD